MDMDELDVTKLRYVLYLRRSTDDPQRQVRSLDDQKDECRKLAERLNLHVVATLIEKRSAKKPGNRPIFTQLMIDLRTGKYDAILAWNPDRLARNMKEGGEIIDMIDEDIIKDLKFVTHHFSKDANGKMLLGMAFVLSKQYSDNLSQNILRGVQNKLEEGKGHTYKHGYKRDQDGFYRPDGHNFELICEAWKMRIKGGSIANISKYMNEKGYDRVMNGKNGTKHVRMSKQRLSNLFHDPIYFGILLQADKKSDLRIAYNFQPACSEEEYIAVQALSTNKGKRYNLKKYTFLPFRGMVLCSFCGNPMYAAASRGYTRYLYFRCDNRLCTRKKRSIRSKIIIDYIDNFLKNGLNLTSADYDRYYAGLTKISDEKREHLQTELFSKQAVLRNNRENSKTLSLSLAKKDLPDIAVKNISKELEEMQNQEDELKSEIAKLKGMIHAPEKDRLSIEQFLNLSKSAGRLVKSADAVVRDRICRFIFLNFIVDEEKVLSYKLKEPFSTLLKTRVVQSAGDDGT